MAELMKFKSLESEIYREYIFPTGKVRIDYPLMLNVSPSGGHKIIDINSVSHYIPTGWIHLQWVVKPGCKNFDF